MGGLDAHQNDVFFAYRSNQYLLYDFPMNPLMKGIVLPQFAQNMAKRPSVADDMADCLDRLLSRPDTKSRNKRVLDWLDTAVPSWMDIARDPYFWRWLLEVNPQTQKERARLLIDAWISRDEKTLATLFQLYVDVRLMRRPLGYGTPLKGLKQRVGDLLFKHYEIIDLLGAGGFGEVFLVYSHEPNIEVFLALKVMRADKVSQEARQKFEIESRMLLGLASSPYLVAARFIEIQGDQVALAMDYVAPDRRGRTTLQEHIYAAGVPFEQQLRWAMECCTGLMTAYACGIKAHRDLKPANILIGRQHEAQVSDFGLASLGLVPGATRAHSLIEDQIHESSLQNDRGTSLGTPAYMAPEQFIDASACDVRSDIYSLGITFYELAQGKLPFIPQSEEAMVPQRAFASLARMHAQTPLPAMESPLAAIINKCCAKRPEQRYPSMDALLSDLKRLATKFKVPHIQAESNDSDILGRYNKLANQAVAHAGFNEHEKAIPLYREAIALFDLGRAAFDLGLSLQSLARYQEAIAAYQSLRGDKSADVEVNIGFCESRSRGWAYALPHYQLATELDPENFNAWENLARAYFATSKPELALQTMGKVLPFPQAGAMHWMEKGQIELACGKWTEADRSLRIALSHQPALSQALQDKALDLLENIQRQHLLLAAKRILGPGYNEDRLRLALDNGIVAARQAKSDESKVIQAIRSAEPAIIYSQAEKIVRELLTVRQQAR